MRARPFVPWLLVASIYGCFEADPRDDDPPATTPGADASTPPAPPAVPPEPPVAPLPVVLPPADISRCDDAPVLPLDAEMRGVEPSVSPSVFESCWTGFGAIGYFRLSLPPRTGVEIVTRGVAPPVTNVTDRCAPSAESECRYLGPNGFFGPDQTERTHYVGNSTGETWALVVAVWWGEGWPRAPFDIETHSSPLPAESACESARMLPPGELVPASPGGFFGACGNADNGLFYRIEVPAMSRAVALEGSDPLHPMSACNCSSDDTDPFHSTLENLSDAPAEALLFAQSSVGFAIETMPASARCETAPLLALDGMPSFFDMDLAGAPVVACDSGFSDGAHFARVEIPAGTAVRVTADFPAAGPEQGTLLWARTSCSTDECAAVVSSFLGAASTDIVLVAPPDSPGSWVVGIAMTALPFPDQTAALSASFVL